MISDKYTKYNCSKWSWNNLGGQDVAEEYLFKVWCITWMCLIDCIHGSFHFALSLYPFNWSSDKLAGDMSNILLSQVHFPPDVLFSRLLWKYVCSDIISGWWCLSIIIIQMCSFQVECFIVRFCYSPQNVKMFRICRLTESGRKASVASIAFRDLMSAWDLTSTEDRPLFVNFARCPMTLQAQTLRTTHFGTTMLLCHEVWIRLWQISWNSIS